jgi:hypothetical protein
LLSLSLRRQGIGRELVTAAAMHAGMAHHELAWHVPFTRDGAALATAITWEVGQPLRTTRG